MASVELGPLSQHLDNDEVAAIKKAVREAELAKIEFDDEADSAVIDRALDDDMFADFLDRLDANDASCDIYLPGDFEIVLDAAGYRVGSAQALLVILEDLKEEIFIEDEDEEEDEDADYDENTDDDDDDPYSESATSNSMGLKDESMRQIWRVLYKAANAALGANVCIFVKT